MWGRLSRYNLWAMNRFWSGVGGSVLVCALVLSAPALAQIIKGTNGDDKLIGTKNADRLIGKDGDDTLRSSEGKDVVFGNEGNDFIKSGQDFDEIKAGKGDDEIHTRDGELDNINCGPGEDTVLAERSRTTARVRAVKASSGRGLLGVRARRRREVLPPPESARRTTEGITTRDAAANA